MPVEATWSYTSLNLLCADLDSNNSARIQLVVFKLISASLESVSDLFLGFLYSSKPLLARKNQIFIGSRPHVFKALMFLRDAPTRKEFYSI